MFELNCPSFVWISYTGIGFSCYFTAFTNNDILSLAYYLGGVSQRNSSITSPLANYSVNTITYSVPAGAKSSYVTAQINSLGFIKHSSLIYCKLFFQIQK